ncbi:hypothetical protein LVY65_10165 [Sphingomonas sp. G124]|uniref:Uncharacterized protein n=1 Tax=Sphingomonas cremea TaxID=2904799 RepID=A0A9X1TWJ1_9SPHN|nr:hypothetical protein [Sphingomonas cremea]MCF2515424.1 hypothetical protein [Sphingomonas cremea]
MIELRRVKLKCRLRMISMHSADERSQAAAAKHSRKSSAWLRGPKIIAPFGPLL